MWDSGFTSDEDICGSEAASSHSKRMKTARNRTFAMRGAANVPEFTTNSIIAEEVKKMKSIPARASCRSCPTLEKAESAEKPSTHLTTCKRANHTSRCPCKKKRTDRPLFKRSSTLQEAYDHCRSYFFSKHEKKNESTTKNEQPRAPTTKPNSTSSKAYTRRNCGKAMMVAHTLMLAIALVVVFLLVWTLNSRNRLLQKRIDRMEIYANDAFLGIEMRFNNHAFRQATGQRRTDKTHSVEGAMFHSRLATAETNAKTPILSNTPDSPAASVRFCKFSILCSETAYVECAKTPISMCSNCSNASSAILITYIFIVSTLTIVGNILVIYSVFSSDAHDLNELEYLKASLAFSDLLNGMYLAAVIIPNVAWTLHSTAQQVTAEQLRLRGSPEALVGSLFYILLFTSPIYHLFVMSLLQLRAASRPPFTGFCGTFVAMLVVWMLALLAATIPTWFKGSFEPTYYQEIFLYFISTTSHGEAKIGVMILFGFVITPYIFMLTLTAMAGCAHSQRRDVTKATDTNCKNVCAKYSFTVGSLTLMEIGFTAVTAPVVIVMGLFYAGNITCEEYAKTFFACFCVYSARSVVNVLVYIVRDKKFRCDVRKLLGTFKWRRAKQAGVA